MRAKNKRQSKNTKSGPSTKIDERLLCYFRKQKHLIQANVAEAIDVHPVTYQRIEASGRTCDVTAKKLAEFFHVSLDVLQGVEPPEPWVYQQKIEQRIREVLATNETPSLQQGLQQTIANTIFTLGSTEDNREDAIRYLAEDIAQRIEAAQLVRNKNEIAALCELTGFSEEELLRPANVDGIWFVNIFESRQSDRNKISAEGNTRSEVIQRANWAIALIKNAVKDSFDSCNCSDESIRLYEDGYWNLIEIKHPWSRQKIRIDLVRCLPDAKGLRWVKPSRHDEYLIRDPLTKWARDNFNFVCDFNGKQSPSGDIRQLRFLITEYNRNNQGFLHPTGKMVISGHLGNLNEMYDQALTRAQQEGTAHRRAQSWLTTDLKYALAPFLSDYPRECWNISGLDIDLDENKSKDRKRPLLERYFGRKYSIELVEQVGEGKFEPVPWREQDRKVLNESIQKMLDSPNDRDWIADEPRRAFIPYSGEP